MIRLQVPRYSDSIGPMQPPPADLASHFRDCGALNTNLTLLPGGRMVISDDMLDGTVGDLAAIGMAAVVARDAAVARAAILPLGIAAGMVEGAKRHKYEKLFALIEEQAFEPAARESAEALIHAGFRETLIRDLAHELGGTVQPARKRYRDFLDVIKKLIAKTITEPDFLVEFLEFTRAVAGKLDFGIYAMCVDRLFVSPRIPLDVKTALFREILKYPPLVRKELTTNLLVSDTAPVELIRVAHQEMGGVLTRDQITEVVLFTTLKRVWQAERQRTHRTVAKS